MPRAQLSPSQRKFLGDLLDGKEVIETRPPTVDPKPNPKPKPSAAKPKNTTAKTRSSPYRSVYCKHKPTIRQEFERLVRRFRKWLLDES